MQHSITRALILSFCSLMFISACATRLAVVSPMTTDLSGTWVLDPEISQPVLRRPQRPSDSGREAGEGETGAMGGMGGGDRENDRGQPGNDGGAQLTSAMRATEMTIEQNHDSMGVAYPNELYRDVDWGKKEFYNETVNAGWREDQLIVITESEQITLTETYQLNINKDILTLTLAIKDRSGTNEFLRVFNLQK